MWWRLSLQDYPQWLRASRSLVAAALWASRFFDEVHGRRAARRRVRSGPSCLHAWNAARLPNRASGNTHARETS
eukprot:1589931-Prymnesium_polylepis.2